MNKLPSYELRSRLYNLFRFSSYLGHPQLKTLNPSKKWKMLLTMRDLRLWISENAPLSSRYDKHAGEMEAIIREINYLQYRGIKLK
jgi:hypothetical protein